VATSSFPGYTAGQRLTAADLAAGDALIIYKTTSTDRTSTTTFTDDPELTFALTGSAIYVVEFYLFYAGNTGLMQTKWTVPSGASGNRSAMGPGSTSTGGTGSAADNISMRSGVHGYTTAVLYGNRGVGSLNQLIAVETSLLTTASAGTCAISWTQGTSNAAATRMGAGSWARVLRVA
jgi:hypothetical protein